MDKLWAPWRSKYIYLRKRKGCIFCVNAKEKKDRKHYVLARSKHAFSMLNIYPYNTGHVMVNPYAHVDTPEKLDAATLAEIWQLTNVSMRALRLASNPHAFNLGANVGKASGGGIDQHFHFHVVPRWLGDTNFMPILAATRVLPENLNDLYARLKPAFEQCALRPDQ